MSYIPPININMKNILIVTPDRVGSTLLQRLTTIYAYFNNASQPVPAINIHELSNGIVEQYSDKFQTTILGKESSKWGYYQSLPQITELLMASKTPIIARLAKYHLDARQDSKIDQMKFYEFLNENFFIISARRFNVFEQAISWCIYGESKKLNVHSIKEKEETYQNLYKYGMTVDPYVLQKHLQKYVDYENWVERHFNVSSHFYYDKDFENIENYILSLNPFAHIKNKKTWEDFCGLDFHKWNKIHYLSTTRKSNVKLRDLYTSPEINQYIQSKQKIQELQNDDIIPNGVPYKLQTLKEKSSIINNFEECVDVYRSWSLDQGKTTYTVEQLSDLANKEDGFYNSKELKPIEVPASFMSAVPNTTNT